MWVTKTCRTSSESTPLSFKPRITFSTQVVGPVSIIAADPSPIRRRQAGGSRRLRVRLLCVFEREVRVLDNAEHVAVRVEDGRHPDVVADVLNAAVLCRPEFEEPTDRRVRTITAPVSDHAGAGSRDIGLVRLQPELESSNVKTDVERLVEVRPDTEHQAVPFLRPVEIPHVIDSGPQPMEHYPYPRSQVAVSLRGLIVRSSLPPPKM